MRPRSKLDPGAESHCTGVSDAARTPARASHDYVRHGTSSLYAALDLTTGKVIGALHSRDRAQEFLAFLKKINSEVPDDLDIHLVLDNAATHKTPAVQRWLAAHHRFVLHFTPTSSTCGPRPPIKSWPASATSKLMTHDTSEASPLTAEHRGWSGDRVAVRLCGWLRGGTPRAHLGSTMCWMGA